MKRNLLSGCAAILAAMLMWVSCGGPPVVISDSERAKARDDRMKALVDDARGGAAGTLQDKPPGGEQAGPTASRPTSPEMTSGRIVAVDRPNVTVFIISGASPKKGEVFMAYRGAKPVGKIEMIGLQGKNWQAKIVYEVEGLHVFAEDLVTGPVD